MISVHASHFSEVGTVFWSFPGGSVVKNLPAMQEMQVRSLGQEDPWEDPSRIYKSTPVFSPGKFHGQGSLGNSMDRGAWWATLRGVTRELDMTEHARSHILIQSFHKCAGSP